MGRTKAMIINKRLTHRGNLPIEVANKRRITLEGNYWTRPTYSKVFC